MRTVVVPTAHSVPTTSFSTSVSRWLRSWLCRVSTLIYCATNRHWFMDAATAAIASIKKAFHSISQGSVREAKNYLKESSSLACEPRLMGHWLMPRVQFICRLYGTLSGVDYGSLRTESI